MRTHFDTNRFIVYGTLILLAILPGCGSDDGGMGPTPATPPTHYEVSVKMSSIHAIQDCESTPGNPGEFDVRLVVRKDDEFGNQVTVGSFGPDRMVIGDGSVLGSTMEPIHFLMLNEPGATFQVEYWVSEMDGSVADLDKHGWVTHQLDRREDQQWAAGSRAYETYSERDGEKYGILKFVVWGSSAEDCQGFANYQVTWKPVWQ